jgi:hypothetical protein
MADPVRAGGKNPFEYQKPDVEQVERIERIRKCCDCLHTVILNNAPSSRERSLAITKLEEVSMWANKAIVFEEK